MNTTPECLRCSNLMEEGFVADHGHGTVFVATWVKGKPERSFWQGTKTADRDLHKVQTFRCPKCGYLESYAKG